MKKPRSARKTSSKPQTNNGRRARRGQVQRRKRKRRGRIARGTRQPKLFDTRGIYRSGVKRLVEKTLGEVLHHKQLLSTFMIVYGLIHSSQLSIAAVGTAMARAFGKKPKHGKKQVDRCLSNEKMVLSKHFKQLVSLVVGKRRNIVVTFDWTEFDKDDHSTICISLVTRGKRTQPLVWMTVTKSQLKGRQRRYERQALRMLATSLPQGIAVMVLADRGFGDVKLYNYMHKTLGFDFVIRYRQSIYVADEGWLWPSSSLVPKNGRIRVLQNTTLTAREVGQYTVALYKAAGMKEPWCLATSLRDATGRMIVDWYSRRFQCEETFRDLKDRRYGYGLSFTRVSNCKRRDRFLFLFALAYLIQTLMGITSEALGLDKELRANTETRRTHSLFRQGRDLLGNFVRELHEAIRKTFDKLFKSCISQGISAVIP